jgi:recombination protein RecT
MSEPANGQALAKSEKKPAPMTLKAFLESPAARGKLAEVATKFMRPEDLIRLGLMATSRQPDLLKCSHTSILRALMDAASMGIAPGGVMGRGYIVPRWNKMAKCLEASFDPGWRGLCDIAKRSGEVKQIDAKVVYEADVFEYEEGTEPRLRHVPSMRPDERGGIVAAYAIAKFANGERQIEVLTMSDLDKIRNSSAAKGGPWADWPEEMCRKSAVRRLTKYLPYSPVLERALEHATDVESGERTAPDPLMATDEPKPRVKALADSIRSKTAGKDAAEDPGEDPALAEALMAAENHEAREPGVD